MNIELQIGDMIRVDRVGYSHVGIYTGSSWFGGPDVIHNNKGGGVERTTLAQFSGGSPVILHRRVTQNYFEQLQIVRRAESLIGKAYDLILFNCEQAANWAQIGKAVSPQLQTVGFIGLIVGLVSMVALGRRG